jgi:hypothetical protein
MMTTDTTDKPFMIDKRLVYEAYKAVKSNKALSARSCENGQLGEQIRNYPQNTARTGRSCTN